MKSDKPWLAYISLRDLPRTGKFLDSDPRFEDPDIFYWNDVANTFKSPEDLEVFLNFETLSRLEFPPIPVGLILNRKV